MKTKKDFQKRIQGKQLTGGINLGIRALLPDVLEDEIIEIKDSIITDGFKAGIQTAIDNSIDLGKSILGLFTGKFESISQVKEAVKKGGLLDTVSGILDWGIDKARESGLINKNTANIIKKGKDTILNTVNNNIENNMSSQIESIERLNNHISNWNNYFENKDFANMEKQYKKIEQELQNIVPLENTINKARVIENLHNLIKNNGKNFNLSKEEKELANKLV